MQTSTSDVVAQPAEIAAADLDQATADRGALPSARPASLRALPAEVVDSGRIRMGAGFRLRPRG